MIINTKFKISDRISSFSYAWNGIKVFFREEHNARIHLFIGSLAIILGFVAHNTIAEWIAIIIAIGMVLVSELFNTAIERIMDILSPEYNKKVGIIKDISAGAVFLCSGTAFIVGLLVFLPKL